MISAREYYYKHYHDTHERTLQQTWDWESKCKAWPHKNIDFDEAKTLLFDFEPCYSNDYKIEQMVRGLIDRFPLELRNYVTKCFFASTQSSRPLAYIRRCHREEFEGEIVFFSIELSNLLWEFSRLYALQAFAVENVETEYCGLAEDAARRLAAMANNLRETGLVADTAITQADWNRLPEFIQDLATNIASAAHVFVISHELSHYLLRHVRGASIFHEYTPIFSLNSYVFDNVEQQYEMEADAFAILVSSGTTWGVEKTNISFSSIVGAGLVLTALGQLVPPNQRQSSHPSIIERLAQWKKLAILGLSNQYYLAATSSISYLQRSISTFQKFGVAHFLDELCEVNQEVASTVNTTIEAFSPLLLDIVEIVRGNIKPYHMVLQALSQLEKKGWRLKEAVELLLEGNRDISVFCQLIANGEHALNAIVLVEMLERIIDLDSNAWPHLDSRSTDAAVSMSLNDIGRLTDGNVPFIRDWLANKLNKLGVHIEIPGFDEYLIRSLLGVVRQHLYRIKLSSSDSDT